MSLKHENIASMQILIDPSFDMASSLLNITGITSSTNKFIRNVGSQIFGYFDLTRKKLISTWRIPLK